MAVLSLPALPINQRRTSYLAKIRAGDLVDNYQVDRWNRDTNPEGYQRREYPEKIQEYRNYLLNPELSGQGINLIDQTILINVRGETKIDNGILRVSGDLFVVDGQHRAAGIKQACTTDPLLREMDVPVVILNVDSSVERARFFIIN